MDYRKLYNNQDAKGCLHVIRKEIVERALKGTVKNAANSYNVGEKTIRKWIRRYQSNEGLKDRSRAPKSTPHKIDEVSEYRIVERAKFLKKHDKKVVAKYIKDNLDITYSAKAVVNVLKRNGLWKTAKKPRKPRQRSFYHYKQQRYNPFEVIQVDVKYLTDIKEFKQERLKYGLSRYIYSARCVVGGFYFCAEADSKTLVNSTVFIHELFQHLKKHSIDLSRIIIQTDNGSEFGLAQKTGKQRLSAKNNEFVRAIELYQAKHRTIPIGAKTWQSDVETVHNLIENEFFASEVFLSKEDFVLKMKNYLENFNAKRINRHKENRTPWEIIHSWSDKIKESICSYEFVCLDHLHFPNLRYNF